MKISPTLASLALLTSAVVAGPTGYDAKAPTLPPPPIPEASCRISYDYFEGGWTHIMPDSGSDGDGYFLSANKSLNDHFFALVHGGQTFMGDNTLTDVAGGIGFHAPVMNCFDWVVKTACFYEDSDYWGDNFGWNVATGIRVSLSSWLEFNTFYHASDTFEDSDGIDHAGTAALIFKDIIHPRFDTVLAGVLTDEATSVSLGLRYNF